MFSPAVRLLFCPVLLVVSCSAKSQDLKIPDTPEKLHLAPPSDRFPANWYPSVGDGTEVIPAPVTDHPYTAVSGPISPEPGEALRSSSTGLQARDRFGRTRSEAESGGMYLNGQDVKLKTVIVSDPVSHCDFHWMQPVTDIVMPTDMRVAFVTCRSQTLRYKEVDVFSLVMTSIPDGISQNGNTTSKTEHLAPLSMEGFTVSRLRVTNSRSDGKGHVESSSTETWYSPELKELIRLGDEHSGYTGLTKIQLIDPDPKLFFPPNGYRIELQAAR